jgi:hypothetical protein
MSDTGKERRWVWSEYKTAVGTKFNLKGMPPPAHGEELMPASECEAALAKACKEAVEAERNRRVGKIIQDREALRREGREEVREAALSQDAIDEVADEFTEGDEGVHPDFIRSIVDTLLRTLPIEALDSLTKEGD